MIILWVAAVAPLRMLFFGFRTPACPADILLDASASVNETAYQVKIYKTYSATSTTVVPNTAQTSAWITGTADVISLSSLFGIAFTENSFYNVTLRVKNTCNSSVVSTKTETISVGLICDDAPEDPPGDGMELRLSPNPTVDEANRRIQTKPSR